MADKRKTGSLNLDVLKIVALAYCDDRNNDKAKILAEILFPPTKVDLNIKKASKEWTSFFDIMFTIVWDTIIQINDKLPDRPEGGYSLSEIPKVK